MRGMGEETIKVSAPCCFSVRECRVRKVLIIDPTTRKVVKEVSAVRCYRGEEFVVNVSAKYAIIESYISNRGNLHLTIIHLPRGTDESSVKMIVKKYLGFYEEEEIT